MTDDERKAKQREHHRKWRDANLEKARAAARKWRDAHPETGREWRDAHPEQSRESVRKYQEANHEKVRERGRAYRAANPEKMREKNRKDAAEHHEKIQENNMRRHALKRGVSVGTVDLEFIWHRDKGICYLCNQPIDRADCNFDHVIPLSKGGEHSSDNLRPTHSKCNRKKYNKLVDIGQVVKWIQLKFT